MCVIFCTRIFFLIKVVDKQVTGLIKGHLGDYQVGY